MAKKKVKKKLSKAKKGLIIASCAAAAEAVAGAALTVAAPFTGGATAPLAAAMFAASAKDVAIVGGVGLGGATAGYAITRAVDRKRESQAYREGYSKASDEYEHKFKKQAAEFINQKEIAKEKIEEYNQLIKEYEAYIEELEKQHGIDADLINQLKRELAALRRIKVCA